MKRHRGLAFLLLSHLLGLWSFLARAQSETDVKRQTVILVKAGRLLTLSSGNYIEGAGILIEGERIKQVGRTAEVMKLAPKNVQVIDLGNATVLPGLIDCHTHLMLREPEGPNSYALNLVTKSEAFRALEGAGPLRSADITPLPRYYRPSRIPLAVHRLPGVAGYTVSLFRRFLGGTRRVSPVA